MAIFRGDARRWDDELWRRKWAMAEGGEKEER
jgi:hypothetical protein